MTAAYFQNLPTVVWETLSTGREHLQIAVCWFSHRDIFELLLQKRRAGVRIELILEYDNQNFRPKGLDFQKFIQLGGQLFAYRDTALMHHKFALVDGRILLSGSFNWTYSANAENLLLTDHPETLTAFRLEFNRLKGLSIPVYKIRPAEIKEFAAFPLFENTHFQLADLRRRISLGTKVWWVQMRRQTADSGAFLRKNCLPFDPAGLLRPYWTAYRAWDEQHFDSLWPELCKNAPAAALRVVRLMVRRMHTGDVVLVLAGRQQAAALGLIRSDPMPLATAEYSSCREVQWLRVFADAPFLLNKAVGPGAAGRFRGSALQVLQEFWNR